MRKGSIDINTPILYTVVMENKVKIVKVTDATEKTEWLLVVNHENPDEFMKLYIGDNEAQSYEILDWIAGHFLYEAIQKDGTESRMISMRFLS